MHTIAVPAWVWIVLFSNTCAFAVWKGGPSERAGAAAMVVAWMAATLFRHRHWSQPQIGLVIVDVLLLVFLMVLALRSDRFWPMCAAGFQLLTVMTHFARMIDTQVSAWAYFTASIIWTYLVIIALAVGTVLRWRQRVRADEAGSSPQTAGLRNR